MGQGQKCSEQLGNEYDDTGIVCIKARGGLNFIWQFIFGVNACYCAQWDLHVAFYRIEKAFFAVVHGTVEVPEI